MAVVLDHPDDDDEIYDCRGSEVSPGRPFLTGDIFAIEEGVANGDPTRVMIVTHPCAMRRGVDLAERMVCAPVIEHQHVDPGQWATGFYRVFPLPGLSESRHSAVSLEGLGSREATELAGGTRIACLGHRGIVLLQQRLVFSLTRCVVDLTTLRASMDAVLQEASLQQDWVEDLVDVSDADAVDRAVRDFDAFLGENGIRELLQDPASRFQAVRQVTREVRERAGGP